MQNLIDAKMNDFGNCLEVV